jgi:hypothetical protein
MGVRPYKSNPKIQFRILMLLYLYVYYKTLDMNGNVDDMN